VDQYAVNGITWNLTPAPTAIPANLAERNAELWSWSPQGFIKAALANKATERPHDHGNHLVEFRIGSYRFEGHLDENSDLRFAASSMFSTVLGDTRIEFYYDDYKDIGGVYFPGMLRRAIAGQRWYDLDVTAVRLNVAQPFEVPAQIAANPTPSMTTIEVTELAPGLLVFGGGSHNSVIVEQRDGVVVIEAPLNEQRSDAVMAEVGRRFPGKHIKAVVNTHAHFDHAGGLHTYAAQGIPVITQERNAKYYEQAWAAPRTLNPDRLAKSDRKPLFRPFTGKLVLDDPEHPLEVHEIKGSGHNDAFVMVYLPKDRLLVEADAWTPTPPGTKPPAVVNPLWLNLADNIARLRLDVQRFAPLHGAPQSVADFQRALGERQ
jgi:glyoxylase-like metal-dependent hydrolase (beta-lactamase superfamily II)